MPKAGFEPIDNLVDFQGGGVHMHPVHPPKSAPE